MSRGCPTYTQKYFISEELGQRRIDPVLLQGKSKLKKTVFTIFEIDSCCMCFDTENAFNIKCLWLINSHKIYAYAQNARLPNMRVRTICTCSHYARSYNMHVRTFCASVVIANKLFFLRAM